MGGCFFIRNVILDDTELSTALDDTALQIDLPEDLPDGCEVTLQMQYDLVIPPISSGLAGLKGYFGEGTRQLNLGHWLPAVAPRENGEWLIHDSHVLGEKFVLQLADWNVTIRVENAPEGLVLAAPGIVTELETNSWNITFENSRDLALSLSPSYLFESVQTLTGVTIELYSLPDAQFTAVSGYTPSQYSLLEATRSLEQFERLFGAYPYDRLVLVQGDFTDGFEMSGLVYIWTAWFTSFGGDSQSWLSLITVHEVSHQWWYAAVGNNAALYPWLDETLSTYSEYIFYEEFAPELKDWWWSFRVARYNPQGNVDSNIYEFQDLRAYINAVYLRGVQMLHNIRGVMGDEAFFAWLKSYAEMGQNMIATPIDFWGAMTQEQYEMTHETRATFMINPDVLEG